MSLTPRHRRRLSPKMRGVISFLRNYYLTDPYMPFMDEAATFNALVRRGLAVYLRVEDGHRLNGYVLTEAGRGLLR